MRRKGGGGVDQGMFGGVAMNPTCLCGVYAPALERALDCMRTRGRCDRAMRTTRCADEASREGGTPWAPSSARRLCVPCLRGLLCQRLGTGTSTRVLITPTLPPTSPLSSSATLLLLIRTMPDFIWCATMWAPIDTGKTECPCVMVLPIS